ncbi:hypothetical protein RD110_21520 [Rhodoferax koreense]|uniref:Uncharacterized protein n=2 Tax=Rhodoferax koreensis TaxID=1842727 RepID=A0A1P8K0E7_9BURK|nr:hypothetical protein RD110_21520 [Rhodoferax koreense]
MLALAGFYTLTVAAAWWPGLWLFAVPAGLPFLNFSPWTGWLIVDECDLLLMGCLAGGYARLALAPRHGERRTMHWRDPGNWLPVALGLAGLLALWRGWVAADVQEPSFFQAYTEPMNSLRLAKALLWAVLAIPLLRDALRHAPQATGRRIAGGMAAGLAGVTLVVVWERLAFPGLFDFTSRYRITAMFWEMHVGGAAIDAYLALASPFVVWALRSARGPWGWTAAALLAVLATYASLTTFSRGVYLAVVAPLLLLGGMLWLQARGLDPLAVSQRFWHWLRPSNWRSRAGWLLAAALVLEVFGVLNGGSYMADRVAATDRDLDSRMLHWQRGLSLLKTPSDWLLGKGLGRLPALYASGFSEGGLSGSLKLQTEAGADGTTHHFVTLSGPQTDDDLGGLFALTQRVTVAPSERFQAYLHLRVTAPANVPVNIVAQVCERHLLYNGRCQYAYARLAPAGGAWQDVRLFLRGRLLGGDPWYAQRPVLFGLSVLDLGASVDIDRIGLSAQDQRQRLLNADFQQGLARWFPAAQTYFLPWHIDNLYLELWIERGLLGLLLVLALVACALWRVLLGRARHHVLAPYLAASLSGVMLVGLVSSVMDVPRVAFLLFWLGFLALQLPARKAGARVVSPGG